MRQKEWWRVIGDIIAKPSLVRRLCTWPPYFLVEFCVHPTISWVTTIDYYYMAQTYVLITFFKCQTQLPSSLLPFIIHITMEHLTLCQAQKVILVFHKNEGNNRPHSNNFLWHEKNRKGWSQKLSFTQVKVQRALLRNLLHL